jgi:hypothetical protein
MASMWIDFAHSLAARDAAYMVALKSISRRISHLDRTDVSLISQPHLESFSGKNFVKPNAFNPLRAAPVLKSRV